MQTDKGFHGSTNTYPSYIDIVYSGGTARIPRHSGTVGTLMF